MKKPSVKSVKTRAWKAVSKYVRSIEPHCFTCGAVGNQLGHWRHNTDKPSQQLGGNELWYDIRNLHNQCPRCNLYLSGNLPAYSIQLQEKYGTSVLKELYAAWLKPKKWTIPELIHIAKHYESLVQSDTIEI